MLLRCTLTRPLTHPLLTSRVHLRCTLRGHGPLPVWPVGLTLLGFGLRCARA